MLTYSNYFVSDFVQLQIKSFQLLLQKGIIEEFSKRNPIRDSFLEIFFYSELYQLSPPEFTPRAAILKGQSYFSKLYIPVQLTDKKTKTIFIKWIFLGKLPLMTKRGHFILNGAPRVIVNQLIRSPGIYYQEKTIPLFAEEQDDKPFATLKRYYADFICLRGAWLRIEIDKDKNIWAKFKKGPKLPILLLLYAMGLTQGMLFKHIFQPTRLFTVFEPEDSPHELITTPQQAWRLIAEKFNLLPWEAAGLSQPEGISVTADMAKPWGWEPGQKGPKPDSPSTCTAERIENSNRANSPARIAFCPRSLFVRRRLPLAEDFGRKWVYNKFMNSRNYNLGKQGRVAINNKLGLTISSLQTTLTPQDLLYATDYLLKIEKGIRGTDDIDSLQNRKIRTSGELIQMQIAIGLLRLEKTIREKMSKKTPLGTSMDAFSVKDITCQGISSQRRSLLNSKNGLLCYAKHGRKKVQAAPFVQVPKLTVPSLSLGLNGYAMKDKGLFCCLGKKTGSQATASHASVEAAMPLTLRGHTKKTPFFPFGNQGRPTPLFFFFCSPYAQRMRAHLSLPLSEYTATHGRQIGNAKHDQRMAVTSHASVEETIHCAWLGSNRSMRSIAIPFSAVNPQSPEGIPASFVLGGDNSCHRAKPPLPLRGSSNILYRKSPEGRPRQGSCGPTKNLREHVVSQALLQNLVNSEALNGALRQFFGTNPLSQFLDQINPLAEMTHKRRISSMGPGGVSPDNAPLAIRSIHPTHYGRICPIETPEGKNTGLVNSITTCARVTSDGLIETPFYKVFKGQIQKNFGVFFLNTEQEEKIKSAPADLPISRVGFLPKTSLPVRFGLRTNEFTQMERNSVQFIGISPIQMISVATSLIPFLEHDDANRVLMGSNMQRQAVPILRPERPIVGTGLEARAASDSGHVIQSKTTGYVGFVSAEKVILFYQAPQI